LSSQPKVIFGSKGILKRMKNGKEHFHLFWTTKFYEICTTVTELLLPLSLKAKVGDSLP
jgi:hypothetical protein